MTDRTEARPLAWYVEDSSEEWGEIVYAVTRNQARLKGAGIGDSEYVDMRARRKPIYDEFAPKGPTRERLFNDGWWFECGGCGCVARAGDGEAEFADGEAWCHDCVIARSSPLPSESSAIRAAGGAEAARSAPDTPNQGLTNDQ